MPRANDNRKAVGTKHCSTCDTLGRFYQVQKGNRTGYLYYRCECGADQRSGAAVQVQWLNSMDKTGADMIPHPLQKQADEPVSEPEPKPAQPLGADEGNPEPESKKTGLIGLGILLVAGAAALLT